MTDAIRDENHVPVALGQSSTDATVTLPLLVDPATGRLLTDAAGGGSGTVTSVSVVSANGFAGTVATATTTPAITLTTTINSPVLAGNGTAIAAATTTGSGSTVVLATAPTFPTTMTIGAAAGTTGSIQFKGTTSGTVTLSVADAAGTYTLKLPTTDGGVGEFLQTDGSGNTTWAAGSSGITVGTTTITSGTNTNILYNNAGVVGEYTLTGTGTVAVMQNTPTLTTPVLGVATATSINKVTITAPLTGSTLTIADGKTLTVSNTLTFTGTDTSSVAFGAGGTVLYAASTIPLTVGSTTIASGTTTRILYDNAGVLGEYTLTGSGTVVAMQTAPTFVTSITTPAVLATANDSGALGASGTAFSDLFLASGAVINFAAANSVITHSSAVLEVTTGDLRVTTAGTNSASVVTVGGTQTLTAKTLTSPTITTANLSGAQLLAEGASIQLDQTLSADGTWSGITMIGTAGYTQAFGDLVYLDPTDSRWEACDANAASGADGDSRGLIGMVVVAGTDGNACTVLLAGNIRADANFPTFTVNNPIYVSETAGDVTQTQPTTTDVVIRIVGAALTADSMYFNPDFNWITHT